jgi:hypothetical protein
VAPAVVRARSQRVARKRLCGWREAEQYFKTHRDGKYKIPLPRFSFSEEPARG